MTNLRFKHFYEATDIFGFEPKKFQDNPESPLLTKPINQFNIELMMEFLSQKNIGVYEPTMPFVNEIRWGQQPGSLKLEIGPGYKFYIKSLGMDKQGNPRWLARKIFQLNRQGYGGYEDSVAQEIFEQIDKISTNNIASTVENYSGLEIIVDHIYKKILRVSKSIFIPEGGRKLNDDAYIIKFGVRGHGLESPSQTRIEQNQTLITHDREAGTIRVSNYNIKSPVGRTHSWKIHPNDLDLYFFPTQDRDEISETIAVHMKYY